MSLADIELSVINNISSQIADTAYMGAYETSFIIPKTYYDDIYSMLLRLGYDVRVSAGETESTVKMTVRFDAAWIDLPSIYEEENKKLKFWFGLIPAHKAVKIAEDNRDNAKKVTGVIDEMIKKAKNLEHGKNVYDIVVKRDVTEYMILTTLEALKYLKAHNIYAYLDDDRSEITFKYE
ncbi:hypothetical protein A8C46_00070 [Ligilactobacillus salivarius]|uniref:hypothetical protein n=1 Tax=Ligilactobacillus salivarius TaxID=1624 RepID=UPI000A2D445D|nr:hypothetical protein [Ligilactobacillus salivarius]OTF89804.1 hypothetical protein A8C38_00570 [Ligilactobacillus salivarius]PAY43638.1 hypothetical protein A8C39_00750 [Ligilactobacillus salivarius]PAY49452.1 hypothetical protein A8C42_00895 [Ligilactobacillus salivarius]PAY54801.1 hypothetical protein A8C41_06685 [Ligilactobacillus salivarius]PAY58002.1 hypothetical protein A8C46_00070 [Ligilactobacillus salivarius]